MSNFDFRGPLVWLSLSLFFSFSIFAQSGTVTLVGGCNDVDVNLNATWPSDIVTSAAYRTTDRGCTRILIGPTAVLPLFRLQRYNFSNSSWANFGQEQTGGTFEDLPKGTYRVRVRLPGYIITSGCADNRIRARSTNGQSLGFVGTVAPLGSSTGIIFSNAAVVGMADQSDLEFEWVDPGDSEPENLYNIDDSPTIRFTGARNFDEVFLAIRTVDAVPQKYRSTGGYISMPLNSDGVSNDVLNVDALAWRSNPYQEGQRYNLQLVAKNNECPSPSWNQSNTIFFMCPNSVSCRFDLEEEWGLTVYPNPTPDGVLQIKRETGVDDRMSIQLFDAFGRRIQYKLEGSQVDFSNQPSGTYTIRIVSGTGTQYVQQIVKL